MFECDDKVIEIFRRLKRNNKIAHAYLLEAGESVNKYETARAVAKLLNCPMPDAPCGKCASCLKIEDNVHPDVVSVLPSGPSRAIKISQIRDVQKTLQYKPFEGSRKICIIESADNMNVESANSLLKTLEEPPAQTTLILTTSKKEKLLQTIISRCQSVYIFPLSASDVAKKLEQTYGVPAEEADLLSRISAADLTKALYMRSDVFKDKRNKVIDMLNSLNESGLRSKIEDVEYLLGLLDQEKEIKEADLTRAYKDYVQEYENELTSAHKKMLQEQNKAKADSLYRDSIDEVLRILLYFWRDILVYSSTREEALLVNSDIKNIVKMFASRFEDKVVLEQIKKINSYRQAIEGNVNLKISFESLFLKMAVAD